MLFFPVLSSLPWMGSIYRSRVPTIVYLFKAKTCIDPSKHAKFKAGANQNYTLQHDGALFSPNVSTFRSSEANSTGTGQWSI